MLYLVCFTRGSQLKYDIPTFCLLPYNLRTLLRCLQYVLLFFFDLWFSLFRMGCLSRICCIIVSELDCFFWSSFKKTYILGCALLECTLNSTFRHLPFRSEKQRKPDQSETGIEYRTRYLLNANMVSLITGPNTLGQLTIRFIIRFIFV